MPSMMEKSLLGHFLFPLLRRNWEIKAPSRPALLMMTSWSVATRRRLPSTWLGVKLTHWVTVFYLKPAVQKKQNVLALVLFLLQISDASGSMKVSSVAPASPFKQAMLSPEECYILDNGVDSVIFVWKGEGTTAV